MSSSIAILAHLMLDSLVSLRSYVGVKNVHIGFYLRVGGKANGFFRVYQLPDRPSLFSAGFSEGFYYV